MRRIHCLSLIVCAIILGVEIRSEGAFLPRFVRDYAPDALWALMVFCIIVFCWPHLSPIRAAVFAGLFSYSIEASQLLHFPWLLALRATRIGGLILGHGFLWSDVACYTVGIGCGAALHLTLLHRRNHRRAMSTSGIALK